MDISVRIAGEAGQGLVTLGSLLVRTWARMGLNVCATSSYMSRIRGGLNWDDIRIGDVELFSRQEKADLLVAMSEEALRELKPWVVEGGLVLFDGETAEGATCIRFSDVAKELTGMAVMGNSVAAGAAFAILGYDVSELCAQVERMFAKAGKEAVEKNTLCVRKGAELGKEKEGIVKGPRAGGTPGTVYSGADAVVLGAATAGVKLVAGYPMTPGTAVLTGLAGMAEEYGIVVEQAEDEIAAINMVCGATYAGVPALVATSGGGFALMVEGVSLAGMLELPVFVVMGQRPGPATGMPTRTAQGDLQFVLHSGHGEFPRAIFAPGNQLQAYDLTRHALEVAHKYQSPVFLMVDQFLMDCVRSGPDLDRTVRPIDRHILEHPGTGYRRYAPGEDGVSPRALPGSGAYVVVDSDEHDEEGHLTEDFATRIRLQDKRMAKGKGLMKEALAPEHYGREDAEVVLVTWGSTWLPCREAVDILNGRDGSAAMVHFAQVWPIDVDKARAVLGVGQGGKDRRFISVEGNASGQFASLLRERGVLSECELMLRYDGLPFSAEEIVARVGK